MTRFTIPALTLGVAVLLAGAPQRAEGQAKGVAIVNINAVLASIPEYIKNDSILSSEMRGFQNNIQMLQSQLQKESATLDQKFVALPPTQREAEQKKLQAKADSIQAVAQGYNVKVGERRDALLGPIEDRVTAILEGLRAEGNFGVVLNVSSEYNTVVAADKTINLTEKAIERLKASGTPATGKP